jgi:hypothetical protein
MSKDRVSPENLDRDGLAMQKYGEGMFGIYVDSLNDLPIGIVDEAARMFDNSDVDGKQIATLYAAADDAWARGEDVDTSCVIQLREAYHTMVRVNESWTSEQLKIGK